MSPSLPSLAKEEFEDETLAFCRYIKTEAEGKALKLLAPEAIARSFPGGDNGEVVALIGLSKDLGDFRKRSIILKIARQECSIYEQSIELRNQVDSLLPFVERDGLSNKLKLLAKAKGKIDEEINKIKERIQAQNETIITLYEAQSYVKRLVTQERETKLAMEKTLLPIDKLEPISTLRFKAETLLNAEVALQKLLTDLQKQDDWGFALVAGINQRISINDKIDSPNLFIGVNARYNLASLPANQTLDQANKYYAEWKRLDSTSFDNRISQAQDELISLEKQTKLIQAELLKESEELQGTIDKLTQYDASDAVRFTTKLRLDAVLLGIELEQNSYLSQQLKELKINDVLEPVK